MLLINRFVKLVQSTFLTEDEDFEDAAAPLDLDDEGGLLMPAARPGGPSLTLVPAAETEIDLAEDGALPLDEGAGTLGDIDPAPALPDDPAAGEAVDVAAADAEPFADEAEEPATEQADESPVKQTGPVGEEPAAGGGGDDMFAAFRSSGVESEYAALTKNIDDIPSADLVAELRELRQMLAGPRGAPPSED